MRNPFALKGQKPHRVPNGVIARCMAPGRRRRDRKAGCQRALTEHGTRRRRVECTRHRPGSAPRCRRKMAAWSRWLQTLPKWSWPAAARYTWLPVGGAEAVLANTFGAVAAAQGGAASSQGAVPASPGRPGKATVGQAGGVPTVLKPLTPTPKLRDVYVRESRLVRRGLVKGQPHRGPVSGWRGKYEWRT